MKRFGTICAVVSMLFACSFAQAGSPVFGLDDNPTTSIHPELSGYPGIGLGAEDPFALGTYGASGLAPSPSLRVVGAGSFPYFVDADILEAGQTVPLNHLTTPNGLWISAFSDNTQVYTSSVQLDFSVDRISKGMPGTAVNNQFSLNQQPGDIFRTTRSFPSPGNFVGTLQPSSGFTGSLSSVGAGGDNTLVLDESALTLTASGTPGVLTDPSSSAMTIAKGTHDNVDSFEWNAFNTIGEDKTDTWLYFSVYHAEAQAQDISAADIYDVAPGNDQTSPSSPFAASPSLGLDTLDNIDALVLYDLNQLGGPKWNGPGAEAGIDYALFSLSHGSASLNNLGLSEADIFFTDFSGSFALYAGAADLGLAGGPGFTPGDNVDALEVVPEPATLLLFGFGGLMSLRKRKA